MVEFGSQILDDGHRPVNWLCAVVSSPDGARSTVIRSGLTATSTDRPTRPESWATVNTVFPSLSKRHRPGPTASVVDLALSR